jgi:hypothetical protein
MFCKGFVSSGSLLFLCFSFMLNLKTDLSFAAIRMGGIEMIRYLLTYMPVVYVLVVAPTNEKGSITNPVPIAILWLLSPIFVLVALFTLVPAILLFFYAPGSYRDDRFPGWEMKLIFKRKTFLWLAVSDCIGALAVFPNITYIWWWFASTNNQGIVAWLLFVFTFLFMLGFGAWAKALSMTAKDGVRFLAGAALLIAPPSLIRAVAQEEVSAYIGYGQIPLMAIILSGLSLLLEGIRTTAQWTAKIKVLDSRWRLLSYGTANVTAVAFFGILSPVLTTAIALRWVGESSKRVLYIGSSEPKPLADWAMLTVVPVGILQFVVQLFATPFIVREMGANVVPVKHRAQNRCVRVLTAPSLLAVGLFLIAFLALRPSFNLLDKPLEYKPARRCDGRWTPADIAKLTERCTVKDTKTSRAFRRNRHGQITLARYNCLRHMALHGGTDFVLQKNKDRDENSENTCIILQCLDQPSIHKVVRPEPSRPFDDKDQGKDGNYQNEVWSQTCLGDSPTKMVGVELMEWNHNDVAQECRDYLGAAGIDYVEVAPPTEHVLGSQAFIKYQPTSWQLNSRSGTEAEFYNMVQVCRENNVAIMVDFVINHLGTSFPSDELSNALPRMKGHKCGEKDKVSSKCQCGISVNCTGWNGTLYGPRQYDCLHWDSDSDACKIKSPLFHHTIGDNSKPACVQDLVNPGPTNPLTGNERCDVGFGADLDTENIDTIHRIQKYLLKLVDAGVSMLRIDAEMLVAAASTAVILEPFPWDFSVAELYYYPPRTANYDLRLKVTAFYDYHFGQELNDWLTGDRPMPYYRPLGPFDLNSLDTDRNGREVGWVKFLGTEDKFPQSENLVVFIDNHDGLSYPLDYRAPANYTSATNLMLFHPWGAATQLMSSFWYDCNCTTSNKYKCAEKCKSGAQIPPMVPLSDEDEWRVQHNKTFALSVNLTRKLTSASSGCRVAPTKDISEDKDWNDGKCFDPNHPGKCLWICQHRWIGVAALARARKLVPKNLTAHAIELDKKTASFAFSVGKITWMYMQNQTSPEGNLQDLLSPGYRTGLPPGRTYCNLALLPSWPKNFPESLANWQGSDGQNHCRDDSNKMKIQLDVNGSISSGSAPPGSLGGTVVIHKDFLTTSEHHQPGATEFI